MRNAVEVGEGRELEALRRLESAGGLRTRIALRLSASAMEPGIFGITRPVLAWPDRISARLDDAHLEAILAHEICHVRRRDNLTAAIHMFVEAAFWFHPMVWWMGARLVEERERACDEEVLELCAQPEIYAQSILKVCEFCVESPLPCVAGVTGADLKKRIVQIMTDRVARRLNFGRKALLATVAFAAIAGPVLFGVFRFIPMYGQMFHASGPLPSYEFVVIKPAKDEAHGASTSGEQTHYLVTAKMLIQFAYGVYNPPRVLDLDVVGGPDWINSDVFDIVGKIDSTEFEQEQKLGRLQKHERRQMMEQSLLADRFKLRMHTEMREKPVYALTVIKGGPKMTPAKDATGGAHVNPSPGSMTPEELHRGLIVRAKGRGFEMTVKGMTLETFVDALMMQKETDGKSVVNQTGLTGAYDFTLVWGPEETAAPDSGEAAGPEEPPLMTAIQQQLGLKLVPSKGPAEVLVIDHVAKPEMDRVEPQQPAPTSLKPVALVQEKTSDPAARPLTFEVASIKPDQSNSGILMFENKPDGLQARGFTVQMLIRAAYGYDDVLIVGAPGWLKSEHYTLDAKVAGSDVAMLAKYSLEQRRQMLRPLLAERFHLKFHRETKQLPIYSLVVATGGLKMTPSPPRGTTESEIQMKPGHLDCLNFSLSELKQWLTLHVGREVVDNTRLTGRYDFNLHWTPDSPASTGTETVDAAPSLFTAIQEQLGLRLEPAKGPVETFVIDDIEKPSEN